MPQKRRRRLGATCERDFQANYIDIFIVMSAYRAQEIAVLFVATTTTGSNVLITIFKIKMPLTAKKEATAHRSWRGVSEIKGNKNGTYTTR